MIINKVLLNKYKQDDRFRVINQLAQPIKELYFLGDDFFELLKKPKVAVVGSRKATPYGRYTTEKITRELTEAGVVIISGLAFGIDSIAHQTAINNNGKTIAVLPSSLDKIYPASHTNLAKNILKHKGVLVSEYPINSESPQKYQFIARNRIIAALADTVLITEAAEKSGSLHTANFALELGNDVFAVPGNINSPNSVGTNLLIQNGATPVLSSKDILDTLDISNSPKVIKIKLSNQEQKVYDSITTGAHNFDALIIQSKYPVDLLNQILTNLELKDLIQNNGNNVWEITNS